MSTQTPREITFEDIRKGDRIACENTNAGVTVRYGGVAGRRSARAWYTDAGGLIVASGEPVTITLLHRPTVTEPTGLGAVVRARRLGTLTDATDLYVRFAESGDKVCTWVRVGEGGGFRWAELDPDSIEVLSEGIEVEQ